MKYLFLIFTLSVVSTLFGQSQFEVFFSPSLTNDIYQTPTASYVKVDSEFNFGYDVGMAFRHFIKKKISLGCGFNYSKMGYGFDNERNGIVRNYTLNRYFWEVPLLFDIFLGNDRKMAFNLNVINQFFINETSNFDEYLYGTESPTEIRRKYNLAFQPGLLYQLGISDKLKVVLNPYLKIALPIEQVDYTTSGYPVYRQDWAIGLKTSLAFSLKDK